MGMFDWIDFKCECPLCGHEVVGFQSKDGPCQLDTLKPWEVRNFYSGCVECGGWVEFIISPNAPQPPVRVAPPEPENWLSRYGKRAEPGYRSSKYIGKI